MEDPYSARFHPQSTRGEIPTAPSDRGVADEQDTAVTTDLPFHHTPVMVGEIVELFGPVPPGVVVDATVGGAGHASALLEAHPHLQVVGLDRDEAAVEAATHALQRFGERATVRRARFDQLTAMLRETGHETVSGALFDLGVSSPQLDDAGRGFSYRADAPLDMRMDRAQPTSALDLVNSLDEGELARVLRDLGDERFAARIARGIVAARPLRTTGDLVAVIDAAVPAPARRRQHGHPARRTFQALRIAVNEELDVLRPALTQAIDLLVPGGRCVVLAYHSGEDRIVKDVFRTAATGGCTCPPGLPCVCGATPTVRELRRGARKPSAAEVAANPRAEAARLRAVEKLAVAA
jgi:16S rRNA (cytosine1402-N4)-methyltransferase